MKTRNLILSITGTLTFTGLASAQSAVACWGANNEGQCDVPSSLGDVMAVDGIYHCVAVRTDGSVVCWGRNGDGQCNVPNALPAITIVSAGIFHTLALSNSGSVFAWGRNDAQQCSGPASTPAVASIAAAGYGSIVALQNGTVLSWGGSIYQPPSGLSGVIQVVGEDIHAGARKSDGSIACWGVNGGPFDYGQ